MTSILSLLAGRKALIGTILAMPLPEVAELAVRSGFDWLWIDIEHGLFEVADVQRTAMAAGQTPCLARIPMCDEAWIKRTLDTGVAGLIIPMVNTPETAQRAVRAMRFPPLGARSVGLGRAYGYGYDFTDYVESANEELALFVQIEHIQAVENLEAILDVEGVNGVLLGP
jgi:2-dehydro-3-deoxyglucarate aldolase/4-hydroxy-2-oxoheptanedioate aldolase